VVNLPVTFDGAHLAHRHAPPDLGADSIAVLAGLGRTPAEIDELVRGGVVQAAPAPVGERVEAS